MQNRILIAILLPVVAVAAIVSILAASFWIPPLLGFIQHRTDASLRLVTQLALEKCENSFNYLLDLRLEDNASMNASLQKETLAEVGALGRQFEKIHVIVLDVHGQAVGMPQQPSEPPVMVIRRSKIDGAIQPLFVYDRPAMVSVLYFPLWRWYLVGYVFDSDYNAPLFLVRKVVSGCVVAVLLAMLLTCAAAFYLRVNKPLKRIIAAAEKVTKGRFEAVEDIGKDEIGQVTAAFNTMVRSVEADQQKIDQILSALRESEEMYRLVTENSLSQVLLLSKGQVLFANQKVVQDSGYSIPELLGHKALARIHPEDRRGIRRMVRKRAVGHAMPGLKQCRYITKAGDVRWMELAAVPTTYRGKSVMLIHGTDITKRKLAFEDQQRLEVKLRQAQKMEAIGTLAGGLAHDFNNLLMGIQGNAELLQADTDPSDPAHERLQGILQYTQNGAELTRQLLGYARRGKYEVKPLYLNNLIAQSSRMFGRTQKEIVIRLDLQDDIWSVEADRGQMEQVLLNLYVNAWQAMPGGGELFIRTRNVVLREGDADAMQIRSGDYVHLSVADTGIGMDEETLQKIFDPFFTTKQRQRGTGLGLASTYGIIRNHGGTITCASKPKQGAVFNIYLPRSEKLPAQENPLPPPAEPGSETILLVDDEEMVLGVGKDMLAHLGYKVVTAKGGRIALDLLRQQGSEIHLVILDMIMPEMGGAETYTQLRQINPEIPVLLCSGYSLEGQASEIMARGCNGFIQKPFALDKLSRIVRQVLENSRS
jgi:two-component system, cell cycle sensor histidine kinase and response regulator CckA